MSVAEVFRAVDRWTPEERKALAWRLKMLELTSESELMSELARRIDEMEAGDSVGRDELLSAMRARRIAHE